MRLTDTPEEAAWRQEVRNFIKENLPRELRGADDEGFGEGPIARNRRDEEELRRTRAGGEGFRRESGPLAEWRKRLYERGWVAPAWPKQYGGAEMTVMQQFILSQEMAEAGAPQVGGMGISLAGPTIIVHGTDEQKAEHLPKILSGETRWCQGFSEPGAGSDLASLQTRAVKDGDDYIINGTKIWTSGAQYANWMFMMARTDPDAPKHRGITYFLVDFTSPGITLKPLVQMTGAAGFNQVFFDNVRVPAKNIVGEVNRGWYVGTTTLDYERSGVGAAITARKSVERLAKFARETRDKDYNTLLRNPKVRLEIADRMVECNVLEMLVYRILHLQNVGMIPNYEASMGKLYRSELNQRIAATGMKLIGLYGLNYDPQSPYAPNRAQYPRSYLGSVSGTIAAGTSEIQRNIIAQRGLGLPRD
ncbi:MAG TPA: acyl-CoA dehydrogenase family protein [Dehalococcoidia bacterium]|nr:acyl-CoA dehydrogenase family protein [Dehalococcoidia bacterium]